MSLYGIVELITVCIFFLTAVLSVVITFTNGGLPKYMKYFYLYPIVGLIDGLLLLFRHLDIVSNKVALLFDNYSLLYHFAFLSFTLSQKIIKKGIFKEFTIIQIIFLILIFSLLVIFDSTEFNSVAYGITNTGLFVICLIYYIQLFNFRLEKQLTIDPFFWIMNGIFFGAGIAIPIHLTGNYFYKSLSFDVYNTITALTHFAYLVMYLFFIKAYLYAKNFSKSKLFNKQRASCLIF